MTRILTAGPNHKLRSRILRTSLCVLSVLATIGAIATLAATAQSHDDRREWIRNAALGLENVKRFSHEREIFGFQQETPPIVNFYLNENGAFRDAFANWEITREGNRVYYVLQVQFAEFDQETLTRISELDYRMDDGDLLSGKLQLSKSGFACLIEGPESTSEQFAGDFTRNFAVNPLGS